MFKGTVTILWLSRGPCQAKNIVGSPWGPAALRVSSKVMTGKLSIGTHIGMECQNGGEHRENRKRTSEQEFESVYVPMHC